MAKVGVNYGKYSSRYRNFVICILVFLSLGFCLFFSLRKAKGMIRQNHSLSFSYCMWGFFPPLEGEYSPSDSFCPPATLNADWTSSMMLRWSMWA